MLGTVNSSIQAQVVEDDTVSTEVSTQDNRNFVVNGGKQAQNNLFHSFEQFSIPTNGSVTFNNSLTIQNIISRVTGLSPSQIDGLIQNNGTANLFLINPQGIIFGKNAVLNVGGSFMATTAESLIFEDGREFSAKDKNTEPLLSVNVPLGLQFGKNPASITNQSQFQISTPTGVFKAGLSTKSGTTLALIGEDILLDGGTITVPTGRIELGSVADNSLVNFDSVTEGWQLNYQNVARFKDIKLDNLASIDSSGEGGGNIHIQGRKLEILNGSSITSNTFGAIDGGQIAIATSESITIQGSDRTTKNLDPVPRDSLGIFLPLASQLTTDTFGQGKGGDINIKTKQLHILDGARIELRTLDIFNRVNMIGDGGNLSIGAESINLAGSRPLIGLAENVSELIPPSLTLDLAIEINQGSILSTSSGSSGDGGDIKIVTNRLKLQDGNVIGSSPFNSGNGGNITINATESIKIIGESGNTGSLVSVIASNALGGTGNAGNIQLTSDRILLQDGGVIAANTSTSGKGGEIKIDAQTIDIIGVSSQQKFPSAIGSATFSTGKAGNITINSDRLTLAQQGLISVEGMNIGASGNLEIVADSLELRDLATLTAATASGEGGNIRLQVRDNLTLKENSTISAQAFNDASGGNIDLDARFIIATPNENSDILASAVRGDGGKININTQGIFGLAEGSSQPTNSSNDLDASSSFGLSGNIAIALPQFDPSQGQLDVPAEVIDLDYLIKNNFCQRSDTSSYIVTGRGGIAIVPEQNFSPENTWSDWRILDSKPNKAEETTVNPQPKPHISPIQGWLVDHNGKITLTAKPLVVTSPCH